MQMMSSKEYLDYPYLLLFNEMKQSTDFRIHKFSFSVLFLALVTSIKQR